LFDHDLRLFERAENLPVEAFLPFQIFVGTVFSANDPILAFNAVADATDKDEQQGMMHLFMGAVLALRNPRAHSVFDDSPELAVDAIAFLSMLAKRLDTARRR